MWRLCSGSKYAQMTPISRLTTGCSLLRSDSLLVRYSLAWAINRHRPLGGLVSAFCNRPLRDALPVLNEHLEAIDSPGVFLTGEVTGFALIRTAITQGTAVVDEVARRIG